MWRILVCCGLMLVGIGAYPDAVFSRQPNPMRAPEVVNTAKRPASRASRTAFPAVAFDAYLRFFQGVISPVDGARSNMYPTGSDYARRAFRKHGALLGLMLTTERLMHEGNEAIIAPRIRKYGLWRVYDPVQANDWWWQNPQWVYTSRPRSGGY